MFNAGCELDIACTLGYFQFFWQQHLLTVSCYWVWLVTLGYRGSEWLGHNHSRHHTNSVLYVKVIYKSWQGLRGFFSIIFDIFWGYLGAYWDWFSIRSNPTLVELFNPVLSEYQHVLLHSCGEIIWSRTVPAFWRWCPFEVPVYWYHDHLSVQMWHRCVWVNRDFSYVRQHQSQSPVPARVVWTTLWVLHWRFVCLIERQKGWC